MTVQHFVSEGMELGKRFYLTGVRITDRCPVCNEPISLDLGDDYFSYPQTGKPMEKDIWCMKCDALGDDSFVTKKVTIQILVTVE